MLSSIFDRDPDFVNEKNVKWWFDKELTDYARNEDINGISLSNVTAWFIEEPGGRQSRLLVDDFAIIGDSLNLEDLACKIDILKASKLFDKCAK